MLGKRHHPILIDDSSKEQEISDSLEHTFMTEPHKKVKPLKE